MNVPENFEHFEDLNREKNLEENPSWEQRLTITGSISLQTKDSSIPVSGIPLKCSREILNPDSVYSRLFTVKDPKDPVDLLSRCWLGDDGYFLVVVTSTGVGKLRRGPYVISDLIPGIPFMGTFGVWSEPFSFDGVSAGTRVKVDAFPL